jgi:hypothetical protein
MLAMMGRPHWRGDGDRRSIPYATGCEEAIEAAAVSVEPQMAVNESSVARGEIANKPRVIFFMSLIF